MGPLCRGRRRRARRFAVVLLRSRFPAARRRRDAEDARPDQDSGGGFYIFIFVADGGRASGARRAAAARSVGSIPRTREERQDPYGVRRTRRRVPGLPFPEQRRHRCGVCGPGALPLRGLIPEVGCSSRLPGVARPGGCRARAPPSRNRCRLQRPSPAMAERCW